MVHLKSIAAGVLAISILTFGALFGRLPAFRKGPAGLLYRLIWNTMPAFFYKLDSHLTAGRISSSLRHLSRYLMNENHPLVLIFFLSILLGSQLLFVPASFSQLSYFHKFLTSTLCIMPHILIFKCVTSTSSYITPANHWQQMHQYPYDHVLFRPKQVCRTCRLLKPARSKHCKLCKGCVARHDHHCIWIMNCVGKGNHVYFLGMLLSLATLLSYGGFLTYHVLTKLLQETFLSNQSPEPNGPPMEMYWSKDINWSEYLDGWLWALTRDVRIGGVGLLAVLTAPLAWGFFLYHIYLIWAGMTTNENAKWADWRDDIADGLVFRSDRRESITGSTRNLSEEMTEPCVEWPISSNQLLVSCEDGQPPYAHNLEGILNDVESPSRGISRWKKVGDLHEIDNLYDLGFWDNLMDALGAGASLSDDHESSGWVQRLA